MRKRYYTSVSPLVSLSLGAIGAFIFFGLLSGLFSFGTPELQVAKPPQGNAVEQ